MRFGTLSVFALSGCVSIVPSTVMRLNNISPTTADPADFAVDLVMPAGLDVAAESAQLIFAVSRSDTGQEVSGRFTLLRDGTVFRINDDDLPAIRDLLTAAQQWNAENDGATAGSLSVRLTPCKIGDGPGADARVSVALRMTQGGAFLPLVRNGPLSAVASVAQIRDMGGCS